VDGGSVHRHAVPRAGRRRPASRAGSGRTADRSPRAFRPAAVRAPMARAGPVRDPGTRASLPGYRNDLLFASWTDPVAGPASPHTSAPPWRVRALHRGSRRWVEARTVVRRSRSAGRNCTVGDEPVAAGGRPGNARARGPRVGSGHPGKGATGRGGLGTERRTASSGWLPWSRELHRSGGGCPSRRPAITSLEGTNSGKSSGNSLDAARGAILWPGWTAGHHAP
jgi:hypothetical protein